MAEENRALPLLLEIYKQMGDIMRRLEYSVVDVFTDRAFGGNPLAVFTDGRNLEPQIMQALAKEMNLSETTFILPAEDGQSDFRVRIFTPTTELPMAGHPTIGTSFVLAREQMIKLSEPETKIVLQEGIGPIPVTFTLRDGNIQLIQMKQPVPTFNAQSPDRETIARMLSLDIADLDANLPLEVGSSGVPFLYVPVKSLQAIRSIRFRRDIWEQTFASFVTREVFIFTREVEAEGSTVHCRMFAPAMGVPEDPATGAAYGPLGGYLVRHGLVSPSEMSSIVGEQGFEMGRPSFVSVAAEQKDGVITGVYVGGRCHFMGKGYIELAE